MLMLTLLIDDFFFLLRVSTVFKMRDSQGWEQKCNYCHCSDNGIHAANDMLIS